MAFERSRLPKTQTSGASPAAFPNRRVAPVPRSTVALLFISILLPLVLFGLAANQNRRDVVAAAMHRVERTTRILHEHALKVFDTHQLMLDQINERLATVDWSDPREVARLHGLLVHLKALLPQVSNIVVTDASGHLRVDAGDRPLDSTIDVSDREYFKVLKAAPRPLPFISRAMLSRPDGDAIFTMSTRVHSRTPGTFEGVISIGVKRGYFSDFYSNIEHEYAHVVVLARTDGSVLAGEPRMASLHLPGAQLAGLAAGPRAVPVRPLVIDGAKRLIGFETVGPYPVVIGFGISWTSVLAPWWSNMRGYGLVAALSSLALLGVSGFAIRRIALEGRATVRWRRTAALLEREMGERANVEEQLRQSQKMEAVGRLTGGIAHDFNNLLTVVIGSLDLLSRRVGAETREATLVRNAIDGASRAATLTSRLLAFSRQHPLSPEAVDVNALVSGMSNLLQRTLGEPVSLELRLVEGEAVAWIDANQLENAILNLCVNAVDAMPRGGTLTLRTRIVTAAVATDALRPGDYVEISVEDTGTGMPPDVRGRAFEPFYTTKPVGKGTGLGLSQVYGFARQSGGHAEIESEVGRGTIIRLKLPHHRANVSSAASMPATLVVANDRGATRVPDATILVVEDDDLVRRFSSSTLRDAGYQVLEAANGPDALRLLKMHPGIAILFSDIVLKGPMNGRELAEAALAVSPHLPVLFTTGYTKDAIVQDGCLEEGINLLSKPFTSAALLTKIAALVPDTSTPDTSTPDTSVPDTSAPDERRTAVG